MSKTLNAEAVLASIVELRASLAEQGKRSKEETTELRASLADLKKVVETNNTKLSKSIDDLRKTVETNNAKLSKSIDDLGKIVETNNAKLDTNTHIMGLLTNKIGGIIESIVLPGIVGKFNEKGFAFDSISTNVEFLNEKKDGNLAEVDALLENGSFVIAVETKTDMQVKDVNNHIKCLKALRKIPRFKGKKIYGALATAVVRKKPVNYALEQGFYVLRQPDVMGVSIIDFPKGCSAKAW